MEIYKVEKEINDPVSQSKEFGFFASIELARNRIREYIKQQECAYLSALIKRGTKYSSTYFSDNQCMLYSPFAKEIDSFPPFSFAYSYYRDIGNTAHIEVWTMKDNVHLFFTITRVNVIDGK